MTDKTPYNIYGKPELQDTSLVVAWSEDAGHLGAKVVDYLNEELSGQEFCEIEPDSFFPMGGVSVEGDIAQFPEIKFYYCPDRNLVIFKSSIPRSDWYKFLNLVLDIAVNNCRVKEIYTIGGMVSSAAHTTPRTLLAVTNSTRMKTILDQYDLFLYRNHETPPGHRPTLSSYLLWVAMQRNIIGASLWVPVPFYLLATGDFRACRKIIDFLNGRFDLRIDFAKLEEEIARQNKKITQITSRFPELGDFIHRLESNLSLTEEESNRLIEVMAEYLGGEAWS